MKPKTPKNFFAPSCNGVGVWLRAMPKGEWFEISDSRVSSWATWIVGSDEMNPIQSSYDLRFWVSFPLKYSETLIHLIAVLRKWLKRKRNSPADNSNDRSRRTLSWVLPVVSFGSVWLKKLWDNAAEFSETFGGSVWKDLLWTRSPKAINSSLSNSERGFSKQKWIPHATHWTTQDWRRFDAWFAWLQGETALWFEKLFRIKDTSRLSTSWQTKSSPKKSNSIAICRSTSRWVSEWRDNL